MSLENVKAFYQRLARDEQFRSDLSEVKSKEECSQLVQQAGYDFTQEEFDNYTSELLESSFNKGELSDLNEKELEAVFGGISGAIVSPPIQALYGVIWPWPPKDWGPQPLYGVIQDPEIL
ncbi:Nif11-like leader peptide family natural product precursor [Crocosphaera sp.]|uniref:Nif11-like leader peptide family natural product precursor n=1 Tax=Crocosphaera sp. TaxID=2729996 RepID=UPI003F229D2C|nr:Nif11-like leader peptide family natural product precursor [Crocosphaera sp.]